MSKSLPPIASAIIDISTDELLSLSEAAKLVPGEQPLNPHTLFRWHKHGAHGARLETVMICKKLFTTRAALFAFLQSTCRTQANRPAASKLRNTACQQAKRVLDRAGV